LVRVVTEWRISLLFSFPCNIVDNKSLPSPKRFIIQEVMMSYLPFNNPYHFLVVHPSSFLLTSAFLTLFLTYFVCFPLLIRLRYLPVVLIFLLNS
jgi:hypothetical protein